MSQRLFDLVASVLGLIVLSPVFFLIALLICIFDGRPVFFVQERIGKNGKPFAMFKFRTMRAETSGSLITVGGDSRITKIGHVLRKLKFDELPQIFNVLKGEMSFVGPRPEVEKYVQLYRESEKAVLNLRPGITDPASLAMFDESEVLATKENPEAFYVDVLMREKIRVNLEYASQRNLATDVMVILATILRPIGLKMDLFRWFKIQPIQLVD